MIKLGELNKLRICKKVDFGVYLTDGKEEILLPEKYLPNDIKIDEEIEVFIYTDSEDRLIATTLKPLASVNEFAFLKVKDINQTGIFLDWRLEKDLFVPYKYSIPNISTGKYFVVKVVLDKISYRIIGILNHKYFFNYDSVNLNPRDKVNLLVFQKNDLGYQVVVENKYYGLIYSNEIFKELQIGDKLIGYVKKIRDDNKIDISIKPPGYDGTLKAMPEILELLKKNNGFLPYNSKSDPKDIQKVFHMSKRVFKQAIGGLYKERKIQIEDNGIRLIKQ